MASAGIGGSASQGRGSSAASSPGSFGRLATKLASRNARAAPDNWRVRNAAFGPGPNGGYQDAYGSFGNRNSGNYYKVTTGIGR